MRNLVIDILQKLAKVDAATKDLVAQVEAQSLSISRANADRGQRKFFRHGDQY